MSSNNEVPKYPNVVLGSGEPTIGRSLGYCHVGKQHMFDRQFVANEQKRRKGKEKHVKKKITFEQRLFSSFTVKL